MIESPKTYGLPYKGSKRKLAERIMEQMPPAEHFIDMFCGGCSMAHYALDHYFWNALKRSKVTKSEIDKATGIQMAGHWFTNGSQWELPKEKHYRTLQKMLKHLNRPYSELRKQYGSLKIKLDYLLTGTTDNERCWKNLQKLSHVGNINLVNTLALNERQAARLTHSVGDYRSVEIPQNSVIYCDPPYRGTDGYSVGFDHEAFYSWAESQSVPVFISEYDMPRDRFRCIQEFGHRSNLKQRGSNEVTERLFIPINQKWEDKDINLFNE